MGYRVILALLLLPLLPLKAQINVGIATSPHIHRAALGLETNTVHLPLPVIKNIDFTARCYAAPLDRLEQKYFAGPQILLFKNPRRTNLYFPANVSLKKTSWNWDWGLLSGLGARCRIKRYTLFLEYQTNVDIARGQTTPLVIEGTETGLMFGVSKSF